MLSLPDAWDYTDTPFDKVIVNDRVLTYAVEVTGIENGRIKGNLHEIDYPAHIRQLNRAALPLHTVTATYKDGTTYTMPYKEHNAKHSGLHHQHGQLQTLIPNPENADALRIVLKVAREEREKDARPATFKVRVHTPKQPSIKEKIAAGKKELADQRAAAPARAAAKSKHSGLGD
jgi:hypothetical protein